MDLRNILHQIPLSMNRHKFLITAMFLSYLSSRKFSRVDNSACRYLSTLLKDRLLRLCASDAVFVDEHARLLDCKLRFMKREPESALDIRHAGVRSRQ